MSKFFIKLKSGYSYNFLKYRNVKVKKFKYTKRKRVKKTKDGWLYKTMPASKKIFSIEIQTKPRTKYTKVEIFINMIKSMNIDLRGK